MTVEQYLKQAYKLNEKIKDKQERLMNLKDLSTSIGAIDYAKDRVQTSYEGDAPFTKQVMMIVELEKELQSDLENMMKLQTDLNHFIDKIDNVDYALVLSKRYLLMKTWEQIAYEMGYSIRHIIRIHEEGISSLNISETCH